MAENNKQELNDDLLDSVAGGDLGNVDKAILNVLVFDWKNRGLTFDQAIDELSQKMNVKDPDYFEAIGIIYTIWNGDFNDVV